MTLEDLYNAIDWSAVDHAHSEMAEKSGVAGPPRAEFIKNYRCVLLSAAIYGDTFEEKGAEWVLSGMPEDEREKKAADARMLLGPLWLQVVTELKKQGFSVENNEKQE